MKIETMKQVVYICSERFYFTGSDLECNDYMQKYGLTSHPYFKALPVDNNRKRGDFSELMQIQLGTYKPEPNAVDAILEKKTGHAFNPQIQDELKNKIASLITNSKGALKRYDLISALARMGYEVPERKVRSIIEELINEDGLAIESSETGWEMIKDAEQLKKAIKYLRNKAFPLFQRANSLKRNFHNDKSIQLSFEEFFKD